MLARVPDTGSPVRDRQGPRTAVPLSTIEAIRTERAAGQPVSEIARRHRLTARTIYRYLEGPDPLRSAVRDVLADAVDTFDVRATRNQITDIADEIVRQIRQRGWVA